MDKTVLLNQNMVRNLLYFPKYGTSEYTEEHVSYLVGMLVESLDLLSLFR